MNNLHKDPLGNKTFDDGTVALSHLWIQDTIKRLAKKDPTINIPSTRHLLRDIRGLWSNIDQSPDLGFGHLIIKFMDDTYSDPKKGDGRTLNLVRVSPDAITLLISGKSLALRLGMLNELAQLREIINHHLNMNILSFSEGALSNKQRIQEIADAANGRWPGYYPVSYVHRLAEGQGVEGPRISTLEERLETAQILRHYSDAMGRAVRQSLSKNGRDHCNSYHETIYKAIYPTIVIT